MTTATAHGVKAEHIKRFETKLTSVRKATGELPGDDYFNRLFKIIHRPGWTTPAETIFFETIAETMLAQTQQLAQLHAQLIAGALAVGQ